MVIWSILVILLFHGEVKKKSTISRSSTESDYRALGSLPCEIIWVFKNLYDLKFTNMVPVDLFCDNESAIKLALNPVFHDKTKHFEIDVHFIRKKLQMVLLILLKIYL